MMVEMPEEIIRALGDMFPGKPDSFMGGDERKLARFARSLEAKVMRPFEVGETVHFPDIPDRWASSMEVLCMAVASDDYVMVLTRDGVGDLELYEARELAHGARP